jgi:hypothetical protein
MAKIKGRNIMAKGQQKKTKEVRKPKKEKPKPAPAGGANSGRK